MSSDTVIHPIQRSASRLRVFVFVAMALLVGAYLVARLDVHIPGVNVEYHVSGMGSWKGEIIGDVSLALVVTALFYLAGMLRRIAAGEMFGAAVIRSFRSFALWLLVLSIFQVIAPAVLDLAEMAPGPHRILIYLDLRNLFTAGIALLLFLLARLLEQARQIEDEMREIV